VYGSDRKSHKTSGTFEIVSRPLSLRCIHTHFLNGMRVSVDYSLQHCRSGTSDSKFGISRVAVSKPVQSNFGLPPLHATHLSTPVWVRSPVFGFAGLRAILLDAIAATSGVVEDVSKVSGAYASTCLKEDPGVPNRDQLLSLSVEH
jgi:hypothetical protein